MYIHCSSLMFQSQLAEVMRSKKPISGPQAIGASMPTAIDSGSQNTLKP